jgi:hypothetical protein
MNTMKNAFSVALSCLLLTFGWVQPADAKGQLTVINTTDYAARMSIVYHSGLCKDDHPLVAPHGRWGIDSGLCHVSDSLAVLKDKSGVDHVCRGLRGNTQQTVWRVIINDDPSVKGGRLQAKLENKIVGKGGRGRGHFCEILPS